MTKLHKLVTRLHNIGIDVKLAGNYPWIYLDTVNGKHVKERFMAEHGFTIAMMNMTTGNATLTDTKEIFKTIRKYV